MNKEIKNRLENMYTEQETIKNDKVVENIELK